MILSLSFGHQEIPEYQKHYSTVMNSKENNKCNLSSALTPSQQ